MKKKNQIISAWVCVDRPEWASFFPSTGGISSSTKVQNVYWRCMISFFYSARYFNPDVQLILFTNVSSLPVIGNTKIEEVLKKLNVKWITVPVTYLPPEGYSNGWRNQFYVFSVLCYVSQRPLFQDSDVFLNLDVDCLITGNLNSIFDLTEKEKLINYAIDYDEDYAVNGNSRAEMREIFSMLEQKLVHELPMYYGG